MNCRCLSRVVMFNEGKEVGQGTGSVVFQKMILQFTRKG